MHFESYTIFSSYASLRVCVCVNVYIDVFYMPVSFEGNCDKGPGYTVEEERFLPQGLLKRGRRRETQTVVS